MDEARKVLIADRGYRGKPQEAQIKAAGYDYRLPPSDRKDPYAILDRPPSKDEKKVRAKVEGCHAWMQNSRALLTRYSKRKDAFEAAINIACVMIWWRRMEYGVAADRGDELDAA